MIELESWGFFYIHHKSSKICSTPRAPDLWNGCYFLFVVSIALTQLFACLIYKLLCEEFLMEKKPIDSLNKINSTKNITVELQYPYYFPLYLQYAFCISYMLSGSQFHNYFHFYSTCGCVQLKECFVRACIFCVGIIPERTFTAAVPRLRYLIQLR